MVNFNELPKPENFGTPPDRSKNSVKTENAHPSGGGEQTPTSAPFGGFGRHGGAK